MIALNDDTLFVGQIKQLLYEFNLPNCSVGFKNPAANKHFIANGYINLWKETKNKQTGKSSFTYEKICPYKYNKKYLNLTTTLPTRNLIYDRETHRYLGRYLRFIRDFRNVNLMCMYNCFDGEIFDGDVLVTRKLIKSDSVDSKTSIRFRNDVDGFCIYSVPIDFQKLTMRVSDGNMIYACMTKDSIDMKKSTAEAKLNQALMDATLMKFHANEVINFDPGKYLKLKLSKTKDESEFNLSDILEFIAKNIKNLRLLLRVAKKDNINISVLEGTYQLNHTLSTKYVVVEPLETKYAAMLMPRYIDYPEPVAGIERDSDGYPIDTSDDSDVRFCLVDKNSVYSQDLYEILFIAYLADPKDNDKYKNPLNLKESGFLVIPQLLQQNDTMRDQYLLADRMIEYLSGNAICPLSSDYDIKRLQLTYAKNGLNEFGSYIAPEHYIYGIWSPIDLYNTRKIISDNQNKIDNIFDMLGYCDKEVEKLLGDIIDGN